ncbi:PilZ domain-containing protein [Rhodanobacter glycinis]|uniref:PilZ domain-containing protein n=1 Tax=Rhodanobacter glycinis TaxID=582702 RepID=A0A502CGE3_9GAMM|nr:PilZ domain-containing protein [Rhodanobacter glycinis]TPG11700.1 PilZ domain-containing protein [Rhodanobacter glycinis]TPG47446.1 PilZ domain-containing protein [Rhodanobacter glycinis]
MSNPNQRRAERKRASVNAIVTDAISGEPIGHLGNLSSTGMLLIIAQAPRSEAIYQVSMTLPGSGRLLTQTQPIEVGIQEQWHEAAASSGQIWAGYRIVAITDADAARLDSWLSQA